jgi:hypothetical protein
MSLLFQGLAGLVLSLLMWRLTGSVLAWAILFTPGALLVGRGLYLVFKNN